MDRYELKNFDFAKNQLERALSLSGSVCSDLSATLELDDILLRVGIILAAKLDTFVDDYNSGAFVED